MLKKLLSFREILSRPAAGMQHEATNSETGLVALPQKMVCGERRAASLFRPVC